VLFVAEFALEIRENQSSVTAAHRKFVKQNNNLSGALLKDMMDDLTKALRVDEDRVVVDHRTLSILSYDTFWALLVGELRRRGRTLTVHTIHSCAINVWDDHPLKKSLLAHQREFCRLGGEISRIICAGGPPSQPVVDAAAEMAVAGVTVCYYDINSGDVDHSFAWDFAVVEQTGDAAVWDSFAATPGAVIDTAVYVSTNRYKDANLSELWDRVRSYSQVLASPKEQRRVLTVPSGG
jgi:hypothetical protein